MANRVAPFCSPTRSHFPRRPPVSPSQQVSAPPASSNRLDDPFPKITVQNSGGLSKDEIEKMKTEAQSHEADDKKRREVIDLRNQADAMVYNMEKQLKEHGDKVTADIRGTIEAEINNLKEAQKGEDADRIRKAMDSVNQAGQKLGEAIYKSTPEPGAAAGGAGPTEGQPADQGKDKKKDDDVIDAEYEVKK